ncbi:MAG TPA: beta/gamma crystallin-related protein [Ramlibacter sp.]|nr:beta/gamma crystallin-related protein [Ramlibacter sp.]
MTTVTRTLFAVSLLAFAAHASAQATFYENESFKGRSFTSEQRLRSFERSGLDNRVSSVVVVGQRWKACEDVRLEGRCTVLRPGQYPSLTAMGLNDRFSSARPVRADEQVAESEYAPMPVVAQDFRRGRDERVYQANVTSARAVVGTPGQRCWIEREQVVQQAPQQPQGPMANLNLPGAAIGAAIGGILGHQVGGGSGKQLATVAGALGGAALGSQYGRNDAAVQPQPVVGQDVRRCDSNPVQATAGYWDVTYDFRGQQHRVQMAAQPGPTITVNRKGEPRA